MGTLSRLMSSITPRRGKSGQSMIDRHGTRARAPLVHLDVDEPIEAGDDGKEAEDVWLPVLAGLQALLAAPVAT